MHLVIALVVAGVMLLVVDHSTKTIMQRDAGRSFGPRNFPLRLRLVRSARRWYRTSGSRLALASVWVFALLSSLLLLNSGTAFQTPAEAIGLGAALGGAAGNLVEIIRTGAVSDFIELGSWPAFNLADAGILIGLSAALFAG